MCEQDDGKADEDEEAKLDESMNENIYQKYSIWY